MKKFFYKICIIYYCVKFGLKYLLPYNTAKIHMAYKPYQNTTMYRDRLVAFGQDFAFKTFVDNNDYKFFLKKLTRTDKFKALFLPYSYIDKNLLL